MTPWRPQILELCPLWQDMYLTYRSSHSSSVEWVASCPLPLGALRREMLVHWAARAGETGPDGGAGERGSRALHPGCLREPVAMAMSETVYPALMWLGGQRKWAGYQAFGPPLLPDSTPVGWPTASVPGLRRQETSGQCCQLPPTTALSASAHVFVGYLLQAPRGCVDHKTCRQRVDL